MITAIQPIRELQNLEHRMNQLLGWGSPRDTQSVSRIPIDVIDEPTQWQIVASVPGIPSDAIEISIEDQVLTIAAKREPISLPEGATLVRNERASGEWKRSLRLPEDVNLEANSASLSHGVLTIVIPKVEPARPKQIRIPISAE